MKMVKSLLLGSAAGLVAVAGAQAADLSVKANAVEYVKVCSLYGAGSYYIPGTDSCIKIGGFVRFENTFVASLGVAPQYGALDGYVQNPVSNIAGVTHVLAMTTPTPRHSTLGLFGLRARFLGSTSLADAAIWTSPTLRTSPPGAYALSGFG